MSAAPRAFVFGAEFSPAGDVLGAPASRFVARADVEAEVARARSEGRRVAEAQGAASVDRILAHLAPVAEQLAMIATGLRREAAELALAAARAVAGKALDADREAAAAEAVASVLDRLKAKPAVIVSVAPEALPVIEQRLEQLRGQIRTPAVSFRADPRARPGDWRVEWAEGEASFSRADIEAAVEAALADRLAEPVQAQLDLFAA